MSRPFELLVPYEYPIHNSIEYAVSDPKEGLIQIYTYEYPPTISPTRALVIIQHGLNGHASQLAYLAETLSGLGCHCFAMDLRCFGRSSGKKGNFQDIERFVLDVGGFVTLCKQRVSGLPTFVIGFSLGGNITAHLSLK